MNNTIARRNLRNLVIKENPWVIFIQETKCEELPEIFKESIWDDSHDWIVAGAQGQSGGLAVSWDKRNLEIKDSIVKANWIWTRWQVINDKKITDSFVNTSTSMLLNAVQGN